MRGVPPANNEPELSMRSLSSAPLASGDVAKTSDNPLLELPPVT